VKWIKEEARNKTFSCDEMFEAVLEDRTVRKVPYTPE
jgi:hypothetical protein